MSTAREGAGALSFFRILAKVVLGVVLIFVAAALLWYATSAISGTLIRFAIGSAVGVALAAFGVGFFRQFAGPGPAHMRESSPEEVPAEFGLAYVCEMCGMELSIIRVSQEKAPRHCGEEMVLVRRQR